MRKYAAPALTLLALQAACGGGTPPASPPLSSPVVAAARAAEPDSAAAGGQNADDIKMTTAWGDTFTAPKGWWISQSKMASTLQDPDKQITITLRVEKAVDAGHAADQAWAAVDPKFAREVVTTSRPRPSDGWDEIVYFHYAASAGNPPQVGAELFRKGAVWHVYLLVAAKEAYAAREAQVIQINQSYMENGGGRESFAGRKAHPLTGERLAAFDAFVESARIQFGIPGMAVAVVQDGKVAFEKGYGVRALIKSGKPQKVTEHTRFMIGSTTKSLTSLMMARRIDAGAYTWDTPVTSLMPSFTLGDAADTQKLLLKHTMCACTGMPRRDYEFFFQPPRVTPEARIAGMATMKPTTGFGEVFQYSNTLVGAGGYIAARGYGGKASLAESYDLAMRKEVFEPLGMSETTFDVAAVLRADHAMPTAHDADGKYIPIRVEDEAFVNSIRPAGAAWSSVHDMTAYLNMELARGVGPSGSRYVSEANLVRRRERSVKITDHQGYGLGLFTDDSLGLSQFGHGGNTLGFTSEMEFLPEQGLGVVMLFSGDGVRGGVFLRRLEEILFDGRAEAQTDIEDILTRRKNNLERVRKQVSLAPGATWFAPMVGKYTNPDLGEITVRAKGRGAEIDTGDWQSPLAKKLGDDGVEQITATRPPFADFDFTPGRDPAGGRTLTFNGDEQHPYVFKEWVMIRK